MNSAVERAIKFIWESYSEPMSLSDIAQTAILSRFHFSRMFRDATGVSPGRYLSAVRIHEAKRLLLTTPMNITDISYLVGYNSLGSFTNHFTDSVGVSPGRFRQMSANGGFGLPAPRDGLASSHGSVADLIATPDGYLDVRIYLGAFDTPIVQRQPASAVIVGATPGEACPYLLPCVPDGTWFIHAVGVADSADPEPWTRRTVLVGTSGAVQVSSGEVTRARITMRPRRPGDLPILLALPDLEPTTVLQGAPAFAAGLVPPPRRAVSPSAPTAHQ
jgi:AraC-like DNA-binding protein